MKKTLSFIAVIFTLITVLCVSAYATITSEAKPISLDTPITAKYTSTTDRNCYSFKPTKNGYYELEIKNPKEGQVIYIYDSKGNAIGWGNIDDFSGECKAAAKMTAKNTYYFVAYRSYDSSSFESTIVVRQHTHKIIQTISIPATLKDDGYFIKCCNEHCDYKIEQEVASIKSVKLSTTKYTYNGKTKTPTLTVKDRKGKTLKLNTDYTVKYSSGRKNPGKYSVKITFKGNYTGTKTLTFTITPATPTLSVKSGAKKAVLKWNKQVGATGYVVYMATSKNGKYSKIATVKGNSKVSYTKSGLNKGKTYYFKVAAYTTVSGKNIYGSFSTVKSAKIK